MYLKKVDVNRDKDLRKQVKALYLTSFPKYERMPWPVLRLNALRKGIDLTAYMEGETLRGFAASATVENLHILLFFAVEGTSRGQGWGSKILSAVQEEHKNVVLNIECLEPEAPNYEERLRRFAFYRKNGFHDTFWHVWEVGGKFRVLSTDPKLDVNGYKALFRKLSFGFWNVKLKEEIQEKNMIRFFKSVLEQDSAPVVICDTAHKIIYMNPAACRRYEKYGAERLLGRNLLDCHNAASAEKIKQVTARFQNDAQCNTVHTFYNQTENKDVYMVALRDDDGTLIGYYEKHVCRNRDETPLYA